MSGSKEEDIFKLNVRTPSGGGLNQTTCPTNTIQVFVFCTEKKNSRSASYVKKMY